MQNNKLINFKKEMVLKRILKDGTEIKKTIGGKQSNSLELNPWSNFSEEPIKTGELILKEIELYEPVKYEDLINLNKKKYRNLKIKNLKEHLENTLWNLEKSIEHYKELINRTEFWERKSTYDYNFKDWTTLKKANGKLTRYYNDIKGIYKKIETEEI